MYRIEDKAAAIREVQKYLRAAARESSSSARGAVQLSEKSSRPFSATPTVAKGLRVSEKG